VGIDATGPLVDIINITYLRNVQITSVTLLASVTERINVLTKSLSSLNDDMKAITSEELSINDDIPLNITCEAHNLLTCGTCGQLLTENNRIIREIDVKNNLKILKKELVEVQKVYMYNNICVLIYIYMHIYTYIYM
jgi:hypothetical protein